MPRCGADGDDGDGDCRPYQARNAERFSDDEFIDVVDRLGGNFLTTAKVASEVGCSHDTARRRLHNLADAGRIKRRQPNQEYFWCMSDT